MGIKANFNRADISAYMTKKLVAFEKAIIFRLSYLGEECANNARSQGSYMDQTGNLRNSVGYIICHNGTVVKQNFKRSASVMKGEKATKGSKDGVLRGRELAYEIAKNYPRGYVLIVVAGMHYAASVEARGRVVLVTAEQYAKEQMPVIIQKLKTSISKAA